MKTAIVILVLSLTGSLQSHSPPSQKRSIDKSVVQVGENLYAAKHEVSNFDYKEFIFSFDKNSDEFVKFQIDSTAWVREFSYCEPYEDSYYSHPAFNQYPVVNVPYEGAVSYCEWLTEIYHHNPKRQFKKVVFRLPTEAEWETVARKGLDPENQTDWPLLEDTKGRSLLNYRKIRQYSIKKDSETGKLIVDTSASLKAPKMKDFTVTAPVESFPKNELGLYNFFGNVSEMLAESGKSKGGSWGSPGYDLKITESESYTKPSPYIGFRVFMEVIEE